MGEPVVMITSKEEKDRTSEDYEKSFKLMNAITREILKYQPKKKGIEFKPNLKEISRVISQVNVALIDKPVYNNLPLLFPSKTKVKKISDTKLPTGERLIILQAYLIRMKRRKMPKWWWIVRK